jgi:hypothetical protein
MRSKSPEEWKDYNVTARDLVADSSVTLSILCRGCNLTTEANIWKIGARLADDPLQRIRFRCSRCGVYPSELKIGRRTSKAGDHILTVKLNPACWDNEHEINQRNALARAEKRRKERGGK